MVRSSKQIHKDSWNLADSCYSEIFTSMQLINFTVLYSDKENNGFDFSTRKLKNFNNRITAHNQEIIDHKLSTKKLEDGFRRTGFDCKKEAANFPYRAKMKMAGKKFKNMREHEIILASINIAIEAYLVLAVYTLRKNYCFSWDMIHEWWNSCKEISNLYSRGMTDEFVMDFIKKECGIDILPNKE